MLTTELPAGLVYAVTAQNTGIGTYPGTTGLGQMANAGAAGTTLNVGVTTVGGQPAIPYAGLDVQGRSYASISVVGTFVASINLDRSDDGGATWRTVKTYTGPAEDTYENDIPALLRLFCPTGSFTSGTANLRVRKGG